MLLLISSIVPPTDFNLPILRANPLALLLPPLFPLQCAVGFYRFSFSGCRDCRCDPDGSVSPQCSDDGQCACKENVEGVRCDRCSENMYGLKTDGGQCRTCPGCYGLIQKKVDEHRVSVEKFKKLLLEGGSGGGSDINDTEFETLLKSVKLLVDNLHQEVEKEYDSKDGVLRRIVDLKAYLGTIEDSVDNVTKINSQSALRLEDADAKRKVTIETLNRVDELLRKIEELIRVDGARIESEAEKAQKNYEKEAEDLKEMADRAERIADRQEAKARDISGKAEEALEKSKTAAEKVDEALNKAQKTTDDLEDLTTSLEKLKKNVDSLEEDAESVYEKVGVVPRSFEYVS